MATQNKPGTASGGQRATRTVNPKVVWSLTILVLVLAVCGPFTIPLAFVDDDVSTDVLPPTVTERNDTVPILRTAAESQGICYGWRLDSFANPVSVGSSLGDGVTVEDNPQCPRWVQVVADVYYPGEYSEAEDRATVDVTGSGDFTLAALILVERGLERFGLTDAAFVDDPGWAVTRAAVTLPLLVVERGQASPAPVATAAPTAPLPPLPTAGSDLWRDRWGYLVAVASLLLITALLVTVGLVQRRRQRRRAVGGTGPSKPVAPAGLIKPNARRTRK